MEEIKTILIGSVESSRIVLEEMVRHDYPPEMVFGLDEKYSENVSGYVNLSVLAEQNDIPSMTFKNINDASVVEQIRAIAPDYIFVVGISQLIREDIIGAAGKGVIGYHPTALPKYRGRAALPWLVLLGEQESKASLFFIDEGMDSGDIVDQETYMIGELDYAADVYHASNEALGQMLGRVLEKVRTDSVEARRQDHSRATYLLKRTPEDGRIEWVDSAEGIHRLIRATSRPYPGAFSFYKEHKVIIWQASVQPNTQYIGIPGQIIRSDSESIDVLCTDGILRIEDYETDEDVQFIDGNKFK
ncbi:methionyl-tRNA formyltransferase [Salinicoccus roseus]|uniref:methionyl-tRNA formyltransferase n=1 Tax=Salinicoccus roseus TaxID=45670 RepID=UPI000F940978|nr:formyltransferase family protein [Salinicoccus roseus]RPE54751.1 methionyl-tRNA formyltransferase [Salinicoccus roseus]GGA62935.1 methionyl-tRNA formyltransferase [Salinicoccus roseus]